MPKMKINENGNLCLLRGSEEKPQACPDQVDGSPCGDWCPKFKEPVYHSDDTVDVKLCTLTLSSAKQDFVDERPGV